jgi:predicted dehydrogenase
MTSTDLPQHTAAQPARHPALQVALMGYGGAGRIFHAPLISGVPGLQLNCIVSSQTQAVQHDWPGVRCLATAAEAWHDPAIDLVVIATPNASHFELAQSALNAGKHVLVDKPCTVTLAETEALLGLAQARGKVLTVFQNRRFDSDFLALQQVIQSGVLGRVVEVNSHFDRYRPTVPVRWREQALPGSGLWFDLGPHLLDQAVALFGAPDDISLDLACLREGAQVNDWFHAVLRYTSRPQALRVVLHASTLVAGLGPRWAVHGDQGSFTQFGLDTQEEALKWGARPQLGHPSDWADAPQMAEVVSWKTLPGLASPVSVRYVAPASAGNYLDFYAQLRDCLLGLQSAPGVAPDQVRRVMQLLTLGEQSAALGRFVHLNESQTMPLDK